MALIPVDEALGLLLAGIGPLGAETLPISECAGRVLASPLHALRTQPPFDASAMDGYAVRAADVAPGAVLRIIGAAPAGRPFGGTVGAGETVRIFTGAPIPDGADSVLIQENTRPVEDGLIEATQRVAVGANIRRAGLDFSDGEKLLEAGRVLDPAALSLAASANHGLLEIVRKPLVAILVTGDELLPPGSTLGPGQIIASNNFAIAAIAEAAGARTLDLGIARDDKDVISAAIGRALAAGADAIVTVGGASVGDHDLIQDVLVSRGADMDFWKIAMRPGKPLMAGSLDGAKLLGLPGNPVASIVCSHVFLKPLIARLAGYRYRPDCRNGVLGAPVPANDLRQDYLRATVNMDHGTLVAHPAPVQDSSMLKILAEADALIPRAPFAARAEAGEPCRLLMLW
jgi:molybdopterin molybdotransferase